METFDLRRDLQGALDGARYELGEHGLYCHRNGVRDGLLLAAEASLAQHGSVRVLDFTHGARFLQDNVVPTDGSDPGDYEGVRSPSGHRIFRVDHHYEVESLASTSTTPLVLRWIRGLWRRGRADLLGELQGSRYLADHADADILLSNYAASRATDASFAHGHFARCVAAAALRNDYVVLPTDDTEPQASRIFYACVGIEKDILDGRLTFEDAQARVLPHLEGWASGAPSQAAADIASRLGEYDRSMRAAEAQTLAQISAWEAAGRLSWEIGGRLAVLDAEEKIDNSDLFLYFVRTGRTPQVQALVFPEKDGAGRSTVKLRSHGGFDLNPLFASLNSVVPEARFGGRAAAGGSKPVDPATLSQIVTTVRALLT